MQASSSYLYCSLQVFLSGPSPMHRGIVILEIISILREMASNYWPQIVVKNVLIFCSIDISIDFRQCTNSIPINSTPYHHVIFWMCISRGHQVGTPSLAVLSPYMYTLVMTNHYLSLVGKYHTFPVIYCPFTLYPAPRKPLFTVTFFHHNFFLHNTSLKVMIMPMTLYCTLRHRIYIFLIKFGSNITQRTSTVDFHNAF